MQYLLSEEEMEAVRRERLEHARMPNLEELTNVVKHIATTAIPEGRTTPYGCIRVDRRNSYGYCDKCPVLGICPLPKDFSK